MDDNLDQILERLARSNPEIMLDLGCDDGALTIRFARAAGAARVCGTEVIEERARQASARGIEVSVADLESALPYACGTFDVVTANQVIEHLADTDHFVAEVFRILRPRGLALISTENLASWHNVAALFLGWQPFSLTNVSEKRLGLGNPAAAHRGESWTNPPTWQHRRVFAYRGLVELFESHGFEVEGVRGAGYYPLPRAIAHVEPRHAAFLTVAAVKPG